MYDQKFNSKNYIRYLNFELQYFITKIHRNRNCVVSGDIEYIDEIFSLVKEIESRSENDLLYLPKIKRKNPPFYIYEYEDKYKWYSKLRKYKINSIINEICKNL